MFAILGDSQIQFEFKDSVYSVDAILKCIYWLQESWNHQIDHREGKIIIKLSHKSVIDSTDTLLVLADEVSKAFLDFNLKDRIAVRTENVRELILAKAFSNYQGLDD